MRLDEGLLNLGNRRVNDALASRSRGEGQRLLAVGGQAGAREAASGPGNENVECGERKKDPVLFDESSAIRNPEMETLKGPPRE